MPLKVGITGGIGSGKTTVIKIFETFGIPVFDADTAAKKAMHENIEVKNKIIALFGESAYVNDKLDRKYIAGIVFNDALKLEELNAIVHPVTIAMAEEWMQQQSSPYVLKEAAILFESGAATGLDYVIGVFAPQHIRIQRTMKRDNVTREEVLKRMAKQIDEYMKMKLCNFVITNDEQQMLIPQVLQVHEKLLAIKKERDGKD
jgi:dephospho-CoA kinase